uniref:mRNA interferase RelE/StbE n=1 Tax=Candidatus Kentrum sp. TC TaxID=2126339 RepID=A0A450YLK4_9GAMM|nr:MAG: mRNA interferase RelE/StbE [Candidatus Kentron sp. TC]VFK42405.1 MAG: mRNA interferase RelE/StbE [Candidatus Kentron sp. TC]
MKINLYSVELMPKVIKDLGTLPKSDAKRIIEKIKNLEGGLTGDIKRLTNFTPEYRLRIGKYRALFEIDDHKITIYHIKHRKETYSRR